MYLPAVRIVKFWKQNNNHSLIKTWMKENTKPEVVGPRGPFGLFIHGSPKFLRQSFFAKQNITKQISLKGRVHVLI